MKVTVSLVAADYIKREARYLVSVNAGAARDFQASLKTMRGNLARFSHLGKADHELPVPNLRCFVMGAYLVDYEILDTEIRILTIRHGREKPPSVAIEDDYDFEG
ncbi:type II toxin-antitoxin system RelE/ParE family toxin [Peteryoungia desertarenae]|uniref:Type II toxin-antitoxin system RelE/ParE family toxin n=1 Tax=Peteryoungia desertarenae TaxID=1813451 RepID=A0ABX6QMP4_9HYPH|nr:type II toxin-antitoxin system RelE/ParE family toxin [Peteryoungia desertarenae]QLF69846.1 type II toxin-antitoxin system RelE/ParE family toxin [Peteryoungia desertarenae]